MSNSLKVKVVHTSYIDDLLSVSPNFAFLKNSDIAESKDLFWTIDNLDAYCLQVIFIGKTGYGKSTTLNKICGRQLFETDDIYSCTKSLYSSEYRINPIKNYFLSLCDLPGIGESEKADNEYIKFYSEMIEKSSCVVYVLRADQRDFAIDEKFIRSFLTYRVSLSEKLVIGLNFADKIEPLTTRLPFLPNSQQLENLNEKVKKTASVLNVPENRIVFYSAAEGYNVEALIGKISAVLKDSSALGR